MSILPARAAVAPATIDDRREEASLDFLRAFADLPREHGYEPLRVEGRVPAELAGTLVRVGPGLFSSAGRRYGHWFDGDGAVSAVRFAGGTAEGAARLVQSRGLLEERRAGRRLYGGFGTVAPGLRRFRPRLKNPANTSIMVWDQRLFALWEAGLPTELALDDLSTVGETDLGGVIPRSFSAHPHRVEARRASYNFGVRYGRRTQLDFFELRDDGVARRLITLPLSAPTLVHDFIATERHLILFAPPLRLRVLPLLLGLRPFCECLAWRPGEGTEVIVVPIDDPAAAVRFTVEPFHVWHFANAFERGDEIVVDFVRYPDFASNEWIRGLIHGQVAGASYGSYWRAEIDPRQRAARFEERSSVACDFPRVSPAVEAARHRFAYVAEASPESQRRSGLQDRLARIDVDRGAVSSAIFDPGQSISEPVFVPRPVGRGEDDGWLLTLVYDAPSHQSHVAILDARDLAAGPLARAWFDHHVPLSFHGTFVAAGSRPST